jgi:GNAT superfamily N-acetyltransferase
MPSTSTLTIRPVLTAKDKAVFIKFPWTIYDGNPCWVPPLLSDRKKLIDTRKNPFYKHAQLSLLLAERDGTVVGRIGAIVNDNHIKEHNEKVGFFGFFECNDDQPVASALFDAAAAWLRERGMKTMRGPASPSVNDEYGLLVQGFDKLPAILMPYNPPYYARLIEGSGFTKAKDLYCYEVRSHRVFTEKFTRVSEMFKKRSGVVFRSINMKDFDNEVERIRDMYNRGWARNWGAVPMTKEEFEYAAKDLKAIVNPDLVVIAEMKGQPVGFGLSLPDLNLVLKDNKRGYLLPALVRLVLFKKRINRVRIVILGVVPEHRNSGIGGVLFYETAVRGVRNGMHQGEAGWVNDDNTMMIRGAEMMNGERYKTYRLYERQL